MKKNYISPQIITKTVMSEKHLMIVSAEGNSVYGFSDSEGDVGDAAVKGNDNYNAWGDEW